jgi:uncharacterized protein YecE (DUF72 family)
MQLYLGTSGFSYKEWKGTFYPKELPDREMLAYYAGQLDSVEINNTFYRLPAETLLQSWARQVPESFRFVLKASRRITHIKKLKDCAEEVRYLFDTAGTMGEQLGAVLFQLPPSFAADPERLAAFLRLPPPGARTAFEFRHPSWDSPEIRALLAEKGAALCLADTDELPITEIRATADWGYLRLRGTSYGEEQLRAWVQKVRAQPWKVAYVFFKHEEAGAGPALAETFRRLWET